MGSAYKSTEERLKGDPHIGVCNQALETAEHLLNESIVTLVCNQALETAEHLLRVLIVLILIRPATY